MPDWFTFLVGETFAPILWVIVVTGFVCVLAVAALWLLRRSGAASTMMNVRARTARLSIVETINVGDRRRLVLVRRDDVEHLLLIGGSTDLVVERNLARNDAGSIGASGPGTSGGPKP